MSFCDLSGSLSHPKVVRLVLDPRFAVSVRGDAKPGTAFVGASGGSGAYRVPHFISNSVRQEETDRSFDKADRSFDKADRPLDKLDGSLDKLVRPLDELDRPLDKLKHSFALMDVSSAHHTF